MKKKDLIYKITYEDYLKELNKNDLINILDIFKLTYKKTFGKDKLINIILENMENNVLYTLSLFQKDELDYTKILIKKDGLLKVRFNYLILNYINNLSRIGLAKKYDNNIFYMPSEILKIYKKNIKNKEIINNIKENTNKYNLILGYINTYGVIDFNLFYDNYLNSFYIKKDDLLEYLHTLENFYKEFHIIKIRNKTYLVNNIITDNKIVTKLAKKKENYTFYTNDEITKIYTYKYFSKTKSFKKLNKFINRNYDINNNMKMIYKYIFEPYLNEYQLNKDLSDEKIISYINKYFEIGSDKEKNMFISLMKDIINDYPSWDNGGLIGGVNEEK